MNRLKREDRALLQAKKRKKKCKGKNGKQQNRIKSNQSQSNKSGAKGGMDMDKSGG
jgi:hypothetical protein